MPSIQYAPLHAMPSHLISSPHACRPLRTTYMQSHLILCHAIPCRPVPSPCHAISCRAVTVCVCMCVRQRVSADVGEAPHGARRLRGNGVQELHHPAQRGVHRAAGQGGPEQAVARAVRAAQGRPGEVHERPRVSASGPYCHPSAPCSPATVCVCMYVCIYVCRRRVKETVKRSNGKIPLSFGNIVYVCMYVCVAYQLVLRPIVSPCM
jgi:hypothetical protein